MIIYESQCVDCTSLGLYCMGSACPKRRVAIAVCDRCECELDEIYDAEGEELCEDCLKDMFRRRK